MDSSEITGFTNGLVGTLAVTGIAFAGLELFGRMADNYSRPQKKQKQRSYDFGYDYNFDYPKSKRKSKNDWNLW